ncbi:hypothetical protein [Roseofilum casamattae]|uniref:Uncharacterized protein n=1 Tax=Roseofilum casamattae BLCC-M143 TaxID=3022442 RepID=A0ABT7C2H8_9CYAN|nr:hypothetical protein [Roseofilum casamattae]MDJ1185272.1 hypothetical protein [Roseofilum casamattae BLCC-M143]
MPFNEKKIRPAWKMLPKAARRALQNLECAIASGEKEEVDRAVNAIADSFYEASEEIAIYRIECQKLRNRLRWRKRSRRSGEKAIARWLTLFG